MLEEISADCSYRHIAVNDEFVKQAPVERQIISYKLDKQSIINEVLNG